MPSAFLSTVTTEDATTIRIDYVDEGGRITRASDTQYATVVKTKRDGKVILEEHLDENGRPAASNNDAAAVSYSHNDRGQTEWIRYLDVAGNPVVIAAGYDSIHRTYNKDGLADTDTYYVGQVQVEHNDEFAGLERAAYDDRGRPVELRYLDRDGEPRLQKNGYATIRREYWDDTWLVKRDLYFDVDGRPVSDRDGKFGYYREYDDKGREVLTTYLDADGEPLDVKAGYATIRTSYVKDDGVCAIKKLYYDKDARPATIGRYQYGTETVDGRTYYLNADGSRMLRIDNFMNNEPLLVMVVGVVLAVLAAAMNGRGRSLLAFISIGIIVVMTLSFREAGATNVIVGVSQTVRHMLARQDSLRDVINNVWLFVPLGAALYERGSRRWIIPIVVSVTVECAQLVTGRGAFDMADIVCNGLGGLTGYWLVSGLTLASVKKAAQ